MNELTGQRHREPARPVRFTFGDTDATLSVEKRGASPGGYVQKTDDAPRYGNRLGQIRDTMSRFLREVSKLGRHLSPLARFTFYSSLAVPLTVFLLVVAIAMAGARLELGHGPYALTLATLAVVALALFYLLSLKAQKRRASDDFGVHVDRRPRA